MTTKQAIECAISQEEPILATDPAPERPLVSMQAADLTCREREVAALVGQGLTNRQISAVLVLSEHAVATHVRKILKKLGFYSRAQIAAWVTEQSLPQSNSD